MRTTINIDRVALDKLKEAMTDIDLSKNELIELLVSRIIKENSFDPKPYETVKYQKSRPDGEWKIEHINLKSEFYEKAQDLRRHFKFSVSWFIAFAIVNYLDELIYDLNNSGNSENILDNYVRDYVYFSEMVDSKRIFVTILDTQAKKT
jgi:hypothetical protein